MAATLMKMLSFDELESCYCSRFVDGKETRSVKKISSFEQTLHHDGTAPLLDL
jgi:hypothetical protein